ncbi:MAG TPA: hypothetical protein VGZ90_10730 [Puia sp.]|jgi:hypothetical protein|nr:hypothetical protein [Puia sp.]
MASFFHNCVLIAAAGFVFTSCTKTNKGGSGNPLPDSTVYIAGYNGENAILWKNGVPDTLSSTFGIANQVIVSGSDVYVTGVYQGSANTIPSNNNGGPSVAQYVYWKNGSPNNIDTFQQIGIPPVISVSGTDVYYANRNGWKNGSLISFPATGSPAKNFFTGSIISTFADGTDVYFAGYDTLENVVYWKNGNLTIAAPYGGRGTTLPLVYCMYVSGSNVYVGGMSDKAVYWVNGTANFMQPRPGDGSYLSSINSLFVSGTDVYNPGVFIPIGLPPGVYLGASYWKNGVENDLQLNYPPNANTSYVTTSVFVSGSDVYVSGYSRTFISGAVPPVDSAVYWKNGVEMSLHTIGRANSIFVK